MLATIRALGPSEPVHGLTVATSKAMTDLFRPSSFAADARFAWRSLRRRPGFHLLLALVVGLGVGATTAVYSVVSPLLLAPLPLKDPDGLVWIASQGERESLSSVTSRSGSLRDLRQTASASFEGLTGYDAFFDHAPYTLGGDGASAEEVTGVGVAAGFLRVLGVTPVLGRGFTDEEGRWGGPAVVILSNGFWRRRFGGDPALVGTSIDLNGEPRQVVGVLPASFDFSTLFTPGVGVDFLLPYPLGPETDRRGNTMFFIGRLRPGVAPDAAQAELDGAVKGLRERDPQRWARPMVVTPLQTYIARPFMPALLLLAAAAAVVLLIVCVNVANVLLARAPGRGREVAVRKALGATRGRIVRQLLLESLGVSLAGAGVGVALAVLATRFVAGTVGVDIPLLRRVSVDGSALLCALAAAGVAGLLAGLAPALQVSEGSESATLGASGRGASAGRRGRRLREGLVVVEVALACILLVSGGLLLRSFRAVLDVNLGFSPAGVQAWRVHPSREFDSDREAADFYAGLVSRVKGVHGVTDAALVDALPLGKNRLWPLEPVGRELRDGGAGDGSPMAVFPHLVSPGYLRTMGITLLEGRDITWDDGPGDQRVVMLNRTAAERAFPGEDVVGRLVRKGDGDEPWLVVGVVADVRHLSPESPGGPEVYFPLAQQRDFDALDMPVRSAGDPAAVTSAVSAVLAEADPAMPNRDVWTLTSTLDRSVAPRRFILRILGAFGVVALLLAALGVYGVLAQSVAERTRELGIRMALGASAAEVRRSVVKRTLLLAAAGIGVGLAGALLASRLLASLLYGVAPTDPVTLLTMAGALFGVAALSGLLPAVRASRASSLAVLRGEG